MLIMVKNLIKSVISDVDGTLIYKGSHLNKVRFPVMLSKLSERHIHFAIATGRNYSELQKIFGNTVSNFHAVCCDGAYTVSDGRVLHPLPVPDTGIAAFFETYAGTDVAVEFHTHSQCFLLGGSPSFFSKEKSRFDNVCRIYTHSDLRGDIFKICVYNSKNKITPAEGMRVCYDSCGITEYVHLDASKHSAVQKLISTLGIGLNEVLYFGDGKNDIELIKKACISYTTYCADKSVFPLTKNHTRDVIGTVITLCNNKTI